MAANEAGREKKGVAAAAFLGLASRICDACRASPAILHCRADSAYLCGTCDGRVHGANGLASRHERTWLCEVCENSPAIVTCKADAAALCASCDADIHSANPLARRHERLPLLPFSGPAPKPPNDNSSKFAAGAAGDGVSLVGPTNEEDEEEVEAEAASWLLPAEDSVEPHSATANLFFSNANPYLDLDYAASMDGIKTMSGSETPASFLAPDGYFDFDLAASKPTAEYSYCHSISSSEAALVPDITHVAVGLPVAAARMDREAKVMRYREKRKSRKFQKTIRYASRKAYAEARPRIKGRFAKRTEMEAEVGCIYSSAADAVAALMTDDDYCVVPSF